MEYFFIAAESHWFIFPFPKRTTAISARCSMLNEAKIRHQIKDSSDHRGPSVTLGFLNIQYWVQEGHVNPTASKMNGIFIESLAIMF